MTMTDCNSIYLDTAPIIYALESVEPYASAVQEFIFSHFYADAQFATFAVTNTEYLVIPYRNQDFTKIMEFERFKSVLKMRVIPADNTITKLAAQIRAKYRGIKALDSLQLATAVQNRCDVFLTNDKQLRQIEELKVLLVEEL